MTDLTDVIGSTLPHIKMEGEVKEWFLASGGDYVGIILSDAGDVLSAGSQNCRYPASAPLIMKGSRVQFRVRDTCHNSPGASSSFLYGVAYDINLIP